MHTPLYGPIQRIITSISPSRITAAAQTNNAVMAQRELEPTPQRLYTRDSRKTKSMLPKKNKVPNVKSGSSSSSHKSGKQGSNSVANQKARAKSAAKAAARRELEATPQSLYVRASPKTKSILPKKTRFLTSKVGRHRARINQASRAKVHQVRRKALARSREVAFID